MSDVDVPINVLIDAFQMLRAGNLRLSEKCATIYIPRGGALPHIQNLLSHAANKPVDVLLYTSLESTPAKRSMTFNEVEFDLPTNLESVRHIESRKMQLMSIVIVTYIVYGDLANLMPDKVRLYLRKMRVLEMGGENLGTDDFTSLEDLSDFQMPNLVANFPRMAPLLDRSFMKRIKQSVAGNRFLSILLDIKRDDFQTFGTHPVLDLITNSDVLARAPYISLHPHHPENPLENASNFLYALVGHYGRSNDVCWEDIYKKNEGLYTKHIREKLGNSYMRTRYSEASLTKMTKALLPEYSLAHL